MENRILLILAAAVIPNICLEAQTARDTSLTIREAVVSARRQDLENHPGTLVLKRSEIEGSPALLGEPDIIKAVQLLPGVQSGVEGLSGMYIRGGGPDENLMLLDGIPMYGAGHLLGIFSAFQSEAADEVTLHKGGFPARYGGRASGVLDIRSADGDMNGGHGTIGIGLISDKFHIDGPLVKGKASYSVSGRGMHTLLMEGLFRAFRIPANYWFYDMDAKVTACPGDRDRLSFNWFQGKDALRYSDGGDRSDFSWGGTLGSAAWDRQWDGGLHSRVSAAVTGYGMGFGYKAPDMEREGYSSGIRDLTAKADLSLPQPGGQLLFGTGMTGHAFIPETEEAGKRIVRSLESWAYIEKGIELKGILDLDAGVRLSAFGSGTSRFLKPEPRIAVGLHPGGGFAAKASYSRMVQYVHLLSPSLTTLPMDIWVPVSKGIGPAVSDQVSLGMEFKGTDGWEASLEGYMKKMTGMMEYRDGVMFIDDFSTWENDVASGIGRAAGAELLIRKTAGKTTGWLGYTLSKSERRFPDGSIGQGKWFPARYDRRHDISAVLNHRTGGRWAFGAVWTYATGGNVTVPEPDGSITLRNNRRLPPSHRLDLSARRTVKRKRGESVWNLGIYNAYNRKNPNLAFFISGDEEEGPGYLKTVSLLPIIPSAGYTRVF